MNEKPFTVRLCTGWCVEVTFPSVPPNSLATWLVVNADDNERHARQIADACNKAVEAGRFDYFSEQEAQVLTETAKKWDMSKEATMRYFLRIGQVVNLFRNDGMELCFRKPDGEIVRPFYHSKLEPRPE